MHKKYTLIALQFPLINEQQSIANPSKNGKMIDCGDKKTSSTHVNKMLMKYA